MEEDEIKKRKQEISEIMDNMNDGLLRNGTDVEELRKDMLDELKVMRAKKAAEKATKH